MEKIDQSSALPAPEINYLGMNSGRMILAGNGGTAEINPVGPIYEAVTAKMEASNESLLIGMFSVSEPGEDGRVDLMAAPTPHDADLIMDPLDIMEVQIQIDNHFSGKENQVSKVDTERSPHAGSAMILNLGDSSMRVSDLYVGLNSGQMILAGETGTLEVVPGGPIYDDVSARLAASNEDLLTGLFTISEPGDDGRVSLTSVLHVSEVDHDDPLDVMEVHLRIDNHFRNKEGTTAQKSNEPGVLAKQVKEFAAAGTYEPVRSKGPMESVVSLSEKALSFFKGGVER